MRIFQDEIIIEMNAKRKEIDAAYDSLAITVNLLISKNLILGV